MMTISATGMPTAQDFATDLVAFALAAIPVLAILGLLLLAFFEAHRPRPKVAARLSQSSRTPRR